MESDNINFAIVYAYAFNPVVTKSPATFKVLKEWFYTLVGSGTVISMSGQLQRCAFFERQRKELEKVENEINGLVSRGMK